MLLYYILLVLIIIYRFTTDYISYIIQSVLDINSRSISEVESEHAFIVANNCNTVNLSDENNFTTTHT